MTVDEAGAFMRRSRAAMYEYMRRERDPLPAHRIGSDGYPLFIKSEVLAWLARH